MCVSVCVSAWCVYGGPRPPTGGCAGCVSLISALTPSHSVPHRPTSHHVRLPQVQDLPQQRGLLHLQDQVLQLSLHGQRPLWGDLQAVLWVRVSPGLFTPSVRAVWLHVHAPPPRLYLSGCRRTVLETYATPACCWWSGGRSCPTAPRRTGIMWVMGGRSEQPSRCASGSGLKSLFCSKSGGGRQSWTGIQGNETQEDQKQRREEEKQTKEASQVEETRLVDFKKGLIWNFDIYPVFWYIQWDGGASLPFKKKNKNIHHPKMTA